MRGLAAACLVLAGLFPRCAEAGSPPAAPEFPDFLRMASTSDLGSAENTTAPFVPGTGLLGWAAISWAPAGSVAITNSFPTTPT